VDDMDDTTKPAAEEPTTPTNPPKGSKPETPRQATREAEARDAKRDKGPGKMPTPDEEAAAERAERSPEAEEHYRDYLEKAADVKGEGRIP
jgi:hypothetical protein